MAAGRSISQVAAALQRAFQKCVEAALGGRRRPGHEGLTRSRDRVRDHGCVVRWRADEGVDGVVWSPQGHLGISIVRGGWLVSGSVSRVSTDAGRVLDRPRPRECDQGFQARPPLASLTTGPWPESDAWRFVVAATRRPRLRVRPGSEWAQLVPEARGGWLPVPAWESPSGQPWEWPAAAGRYWR